MVDEFILDVRELVARLVKQIPILVISDSIMVAAVHPKYESHTVSLRPPFRI